MPVYGLTSGRALPWILGGSALLTLVIAVFVIFAFRAPTFDASSTGLRIQGGLFARTLPTTALRLDQARIVDLGVTPSLKPKWRTFGVGLPNYRGGWFRLQDNQKALVFLGSSDKVLYIPTTQGYALLFTPQDPEGCLRSLKGGGD